MIYIWHLVYALLLIPVVIAADFGFSVQAELYFKLYRNDYGAFKYNIDENKHKILIVLSAVSLATFLVNYNSQALLILSMFSPTALFLRTLYKVLTA